MRNIILDTETTGMNKHGLHYEGHRIIEIGAVEIINRRITGNKFHVYLKPNRAIDPAAFLIHGISNEFLNDKPTFSQVVDDFIDFISGGEIVIHNAPFDIGFINYEISLLNRGIHNINYYCSGVIDSLLIARKIFPGKHNSLDALCERFNKLKRTKHSALLDAEILADIFLIMTSRQTSMVFDTNKENINIKCLSNTASRLKIIFADDKEVVAHKHCLKSIQYKSSNCLWLLSSNNNKIK